MLLVLIGGLLAYALRFGETALPGNYAAAMLLACLLVLLIFPLCGIDQRSRQTPCIKALQYTTTGWVLVAVLLVLIGYATRTGADYSRLWALLWFALTWGLLLGSRVFAQPGLRWLDRGGWKPRRVAVVGDQGLGSAVVQQLQSCPCSGLQVCALFGEQPDSVPHDLLTRIHVQADASAEAVLGYLASERIDEVWLAVPLNDPHRLRELTNALRQTSVELRLVPDVPGLGLSCRPMSVVAGLPVLELSFSPLKAGNAWIKSVVDRVLASLFLLLAAPLMLLIALAVKLDSPGPVLFRQRRHGLGGGEIEIWKFRTMRHCADAAAVAVQATVNDARVTRFGRWLRRSSLDELPQLINVLQGRMSLVGPRPHPVWLNERHQRSIDAYAQRHRVKPGLTGWAQVNGFRGETDTLEKMQKRVEYDLYYIEHWSLEMDLRILLMTIVKGCFGANAY